MRALRPRRLRGAILLSLTSGALALVGIMPCQANDDATVAEAVYVEQLKPLLRNRCYGCHGALKQEAGLRIDTVEQMKQGGDSGPVIVPGDTAGSLLFERVAATNLDERMPPEHEGEAFTDEQLALLRGWLSAGAPAPENEPADADPQEHWAFQPRKRPPVPEVANAQIKNAIDAFLAQVHAEQGFTPADEAPREVLIRRLYLDLVGVPPTPEEWAELLQSPAPDWYEQLVDRLLNDPRHGERWARHWMDVWRYSETWGLGAQVRSSQHHIRHWRDWIIESLNADLPYDEMVRQMLAGDELYPDDLDKLRATGYLARNYFIFNRHQWMEEVVEHVGKGFLGLTFNCAKCHDHKYDPITHADYYRLRAFFEPYHVRTDVVPGEVDLRRDGIPRAFDGMPDAPTYLLIRGQESQPDESAVITPGVPEILRFRELLIEPVTLPVEAWQPARREWVIAAHRDAVQAQLTAAQKRLAEAAKTLAAAEKQSAQLADQPMPDAEASAAAATALALAQKKHEVAERAHETALADEASFKHRLAAMQATWARTDAGEEDEALTTAEQEAAHIAARAERELELAQARQKLAELELQIREAQPDRREPLEKQLKPAQDAVAAAEKKLETPGTDYRQIVGAVPAPTRFLHSGKDDPPIEFLPTSTGRRTALARWITDDNHPLTARVAANQIWMRHMGEPLVATVFDFGRNGATPASPELIDWLAAELVESGWSMKHLHRVIVTSAAYRRSSSLAGAESNQAIDPDNRYFWRRPTIRLEAQAIRDSILALSGTLDTTIGGPPIPSSEQDRSTRRSLYFYHSNNDRNLFLTTFDDALVKECYRREQSIVPQQALAMGNSQLTLTAAAQIAERLSQSEASAAGQEEPFIRRAFLVVLGIRPSEAEVSVSRKALALWREQESGDEAEQRARANFIWALLNHNDFVTLR